MNFNIYKATVCTNCVYNCNGKLKHIHETHQKDITTWKCVNFQPICVPDRENLKKQFFDVFYSKWHKKWYKNNII